MNAKQKREELIQGCRNALKRSGDPERRYVHVRAVDVLAALGEPLEPKDAKDASRPESK